jgi:hypothetical protein
MLGRHANIIVVLDFRFLLKLPLQINKTSFLLAGRQENMSSAWLWTTLEN